MAKKRKSEAGLVVIFFQTQPLEVAKSILDICWEVVASRRIQEGEIESASKSVTPRRRKKKDEQPPLIA